MIAILTLIKSILLTIVGLLFITVSYYAIAYIVDTIDDIGFDIYYMRVTHNVKGIILWILWEIIQVVFCILIILLVIMIVCESYMILK